MVSLPTDPMELIIAEALMLAGVKFRTDHPARLDFHIPDAARSGDGVHIEVKRMHSDRIAEQMSRVPNVIAVQGEDAVRWLADLIERAS